MATEYSRLTVTERRLIEQHLKSGKSPSWIAKALGRHKSTISRELHRTGPDIRKYTHRKAQKNADFCKVRNRKQAKIQGALQAAVFYYLVDLHCSPQQISGRLRKKYPKFDELQVSHETIYKYVYSTESQLQLSSCLRKKHKKRRRKKKARRGGIRNKTSIHRRADLQDREEFGHWEGDLIIGKERKSAMGTLIERSSRYTIIVPLNGQDSKTVVDAFIEELQKVPKHLRKSLTYDQGSEMAEHERITQKLHMDVFFADPGKPYQRGTNENNNGLIREYFPKKTDLREYSNERIAEVQMILNSRPRPVLKFSSANEVFAKAREKSDLVLSQIV